MARNNRSEYDAHIALVAARKAQWTERAAAAPNAEAFRHCIRAASDAWAYERKLRAERAARFGAAFDA